MKNADELDVVASSSVDREDPSDLPKELRISRRGSDYTLR
jgi:hypothetical protein